MKDCFLFTYKRALQCMRASLLVLLLATVLGVSFGLDTPQIPQAQAQTLVEDVVNWVENAVDAVANVASEAYGWAVKNKEMVLDGIAWTVAKIALAEIQKATVRWINSGFQGSPAFVTDLGGFLQDSADKAAGEFIYGSDLKALCSPFYLNIKIALSIKMSRKSPVQCTLSKVVGNVENFLGGNFASGGLPGWFEMTINPNNNFFGASASAQSALFGKIGDKKEQDLNKLLYGKGFLGKEECTLVTKVTTADEFQGQTTKNIETVCGSQAECEKLRPQMKTADEFQGQTTVSGGEVKCKTVTPGEVISARLNTALDSGQNSLITADEINEVISALFQQLAVQVLTGAGGLIGTTQSSGDGRPAYLDQINNPKYDSNPGQTTIGDDLITTAITQESQYQALYAGVVSKADVILARIKELEALVASGKETCADMSGVSAQVTAIRDPAFAKQSDSDKNLATLNDLQARYASSTAAAQYSSAANNERLQVVNTFMALQTSGVLHKDTDVVRAKAEIEGIPNAPANATLPKPINKQLAELAAQLETLCHSNATASTTSSSSGE